MATRRFCILTFVLVMSLSSGLAAQQHRGASLVTQLNPLQVASRLPNNGLNNSIGRPIRNFVLRESKDKLTSLSEYVDHRCVIVVFMGTQCPIANSYIPDLIEIQKQQNKNGVQVLGINANLADSLEDVIKHKKEFSINFPVLKDHEQITLDLFGATRTPEVFVLDRRREVKYQGRIDDRIGYNYKRAKPNRADLKVAIKEVLKDGKVTLESTRTLGCLITRKKPSVAKSEITYTKHVSRIIAKKCVHCHHPGTKAPFSLTSYDHAVEQSAMIKEVLQQRRMPPWSADPRHGKFSNDLSLTPDEIRLFVAWIDNDTPEGNKSDLKPFPKFVDGWTIPNPQKIIDMPRAFNVPASGTVPYQYFETKTNFPEDRWVKASEARPGNWDAVHHIIGYVRPKGKDFDDGLPAVAGFAPGEEPMIFPDGMGFRLPAGADIVWQVHYTPTGKPETDKSQIALTFYDKKPEREVFQNLAIEKKFTIPAGAKRYKVEAKRKIYHDVELISLMPHMHYRGKEFRYTARFPDGTKKILLDIPNYDFEWQHRYRLDPPEFLPANTVIECVAYFDNSADNPSNPDPTEEVKWGDQTWEEMMIGFFTVVKAKKDRKKKKQ